MLFANSKKMMGVLCGMGIVFSPIFNAQSQVNNNIQTGFFCSTSASVPTTVYLNKQGTQEPWITWSSDYFTDSGWTPEKRCLEVSNRLETYRIKNQLQYVTSGVINNQKVICVAATQGAPCGGIIYTLKPGQDAIAALNNLFAWRKGEAGQTSNDETMEIPYIDVGSRL